MGKLTETIKGTANELAGRVKQQSDNPETRAEGLKQELKGKAQKVKGDVQGAMGDKI
ncbi:CsbD family protein [Porphyrobacter sp. TH134]|uniref:CsbD family protein n=1 Tax=Porphyrobacter sp. TH134 TaxID=2067450 RepID=UPI000C7D93FF|nr:CsbD family protein [Porphyrobacter sp. TH134]PLK23984.1 CsbD family protein [Porphyrobacter sp. TH134]